jgi:hypothetical protein
MRFDHRQDVTDEVSREYLLGPGHSVLIEKPVAIYTSDHSEEVGIMDAHGQWYLVPEVGGRTPVAVHVVRYPTADEPLA